MSHLTLVDHLGPPVLGGRDLGSGAPRAIAWCLTAFTDPPACPWPNEGSEERRRWLPQLQNPMAVALRARANLQRHCLPQALSDAHSDRILASRRSARKPAADRVVQTACDGRRHRSYRMRSSHIRLVAEGLTRAVQGERTRVPPPQKRRRRVTFAAGCSDRQLAPRIHPAPILADLPLDSRHVTGYARKAFKKRSSDSVTLQ